MKKISLVTLSVLMLIAAAMGHGMAQTTPPPNIKVALALDKDIYYPGDPIKIVLTLANLDPGSIITAKSFLDQDFHLLLRFTGEDGKEISSNQLKDSKLPDPPPPRVLLVEGNLVQVEIVEVLPPGWVLSIPASGDIFNARNYYSLIKGGKYTVRAVIPMGIYPAYDTVSDKKYARIDSANWAGALESTSTSFTLVTDADGDSYCYPLPCIVGAKVDCDDNNPAVHPGAREIPGNGIDDDCDPSTLDVVVVRPGTITVTAEKYTVGRGSQPSATRGPIGNLPVRVYDTSSGSCAAKLGVSWQNYKSIWLSCTPQVNGAGSTDNLGVLSLQVAPGNYVVLGEFEPGEEYLGEKIGRLSSDKSVQSNLRVMVKTDGEKVPSKYRKITGSELVIIEPEYIEWDKRKELYPFVFASMGDWTVTTSIDMPRGFEVDHHSLTTNVRSEIEAVQFTVTDEWGRWGQTEVTYRITHKGKITVIKSQIGVKLTERLAREKGCDRFGREHTGWK